MKAVENEKEYNPHTTERLYFLDNMRAIAIVMVVGVHTVSYCVELPDYQKGIIIFVVHTISVPVFFLVDGYLYARSVIHSNSHGYIKNSVLRLLVPWIIFTLFYAIARYAFELMGFLNDREIIGHSWKEVAISAYASVYAPQMYFLLSLFLVRLCAPVLELLFIRKSYFITLLLFIGYYTVYTSIKPIVSTSLNIAGGQEPVLHALWGMQFYIVGIIVFKTSEIMDVRKLFIPFLFLFISSLFVRDAYEGSDGALVQYLYLLTFFIFFTLFQNRFALLNSIGRNTMGIYLIHAPIVLKGVSLILNKFILVPLLSYVSVLIGVLILSICIVSAINYVPYGCLLFGTHHLKKVGSTLKCNR